MKKLLISGLLALGMATSVAAVGVVPAQAATVRVVVNSGHYHHPIIRHHVTRKVTVCKVTYRHHRRVRVCRTVIR